MNETAELRSVDEKLFLSRKFPILGFLRGFFIDQKDIESKTNAYSNIEDSL